MLSKMVSVRFVVMLCIAVLVGGSISPVFAGMVGTEQLLATEQAQAEREHLLSALAREDVQEQLVQMGVDPTEAVDRVKRMTDTEVAALNERIDELPAGSGVLGVVVTVFIVFVITDVIGATDIFPFIRPVN